VVLDAGEGFTGQLRRKFGIENTDHILRNLVCIWISHVHGDHHFGLYQLLQARAELCDGAVPLICNPPIARHIEVLQECCGTLKFVHRTHDEPFEAQNVRITSINVTHCPGSAGCVCEVDGGFRIAYSGDRTVTDRFATSVGHCDLLIHEATLSDDMIASAIQKKHSTLGQAIQTGRDANARFVVLTHFSQRFPKVPVFATECENVAFAFDYMSCSFDRITELCRVCPTIFQMIVDRDNAKDDED
jgi:ribonuclease Z